MTNSNAKTTFCDSGTGLHFWESLRSMVMLVLNTALFLGVAISVTGCTQRHSTSWQVEELVFTNYVMEVYWRGRERIDRTAGWYQFLGGSKHHYETVRESFLRSRIDLDKMQCIEDLVSGVEVTNIVSLRQERRKRFTPSPLPQETVFVDSDHSGSFILLRKGFGSKLTIVSSNETNELKRISPYGSGQVAINGSGDCVFMPLVAGIDRNHGNPSSFALYKNGTWWTSSIDGPLPELSDTTFSRTSAVPALIKAPISP